MDEARALMTLSGLDLEIVRAEKRLEELPEKRAILDLRKRIKEFEAVAAKAQGYVEEAQRVLKRDEDEIAALDVKLEDEQAKILSGDVTNPKEIQNLSRELDALKRRKDKLENTTIGVMEKVENGKGQLAKVEDAIAKAHKKEEQLIEAFQKSGGELQAQIASIRAKRKALAGSLPDGLMQRYDHACETKHGIGVGRLVNGTCSACRVELPSGRIQALESGPDIGECPNCHRLLVVRTHEVAE